MAEGKKEPGAFKSFVAGGAGGVCIVLTGHPMDTIKVLTTARFLVGSCVTMDVAPRIKRQQQTLGSVMGRWVAWFVHGLC